MSQNTKILMVEDHQRYHQLFANEITDAMAAEIDFVTTGEDALKKLDQDPRHYDVMLLDLNLPGINGEEVLEKVRNNASYEDLRIIILTGTTDQMIQSRLFGLGADEFIEKGSAPEVFIARLKAQTRQKLALDRLTQLAVDRESFAAGVLHDIRNIEMNLLAACEIVQMQVKDDPAGKQEQILADLDEFKKQINRIDTYATSVIQKVRAGSSEMRIESVPWQEVIEWTLAFLTGGKTELKVEKLDEARWQPVSADRHLLQVACLNIFQNSVKYFRPGVDPVIVVSQFERDNQICTALKDNGIGVPKEALRKIFEPFYRAHEQKSAESHGLGLSMVSNVLQKMNGRVWAEVREDGEDGTVFVIALPKGT